MDEGYIPRDGIKNVCICDKLEVTPMVKKMRPLEMVQACATEAYKCTNLSAPVQRIDRIIVNKVRRT